MGGRKTIPAISLAEEEPPDGGANRGQAEQSENHPNDDMRNLYSEDQRQNADGANCAKSFVTREGVERAAKAYVAPEVGLPWQNG